VYDTHTVLKQKVQPVFTFILPSASLIKIKDDNISVAKSGQASEEGFKSYLDVASISDY